MKRWKSAAIIAVVGMILPNVLFAQGLGDQLSGMQQVLKSLHDEMIADSMLNKMMDIGRGLAGFGAIWYIAYRVWRHIANAEAIDFYPLLRPFALGLAIMLFPALMSALHSLLSPIESATGKMVQDSDKAIKVLLKQKEEAVKKSSAYQMYVGSNGSGDREKWLKYTKGVSADDPDVSEGVFESIGNDIKFSMAKASYSFRNSVKEWMSQVLQLLYMAAALCINTLRTFNMVILTLLGPLVLGFAVYDGFQNSLTAWLSRYINIFLWLPVANLFGAIIGRIQEKMTQMDIEMINQTGDTFFSSSDAGYLIFMIIAIVGYFTVPTVAGYIVNVGGGGGMVQKVTSLLASSAVMAKSIGSGGLSRVGSGAYNIANAGRYMNEGKNSDVASGDRHRGDGASGAVGRAMGSYMASKLSGSNKQDDNPPMGRD